MFYVSDNNSESVGENQNTINFEGNGQIPFYNSEQTCQLTINNEVSTSTTETFPNKRKIIKGFLKNKRNKKSGKHTRKNLDNKRRKLLGKMLKIIVDFINCKNGIKEDEKQIKEIRFNESNYFKNDNIQKLLYKTLKDILNTDIRKNYKKYKPNHNNELIKEYEKGNNDLIKSILNYKLIECIQYFRKDPGMVDNNHLKEEGDKSPLKGLEQYYDELVQYTDELTDSDDKNYMEDIIDLINQFEKKFNKKSKEENLKIQS